MVEFGWNMIKVNTAPNMAGANSGGSSNSANVSLQGEISSTQAAAANNPAGANGGQ